MSVDGWNTVLVLGGIRSGKSAFAESLVTDAAQVRYIATAAPALPVAPDPALTTGAAGAALIAGTTGATMTANAAADQPVDPQWAARIAAHRGRRPANWVTEEIGADPARLRTLIAEAKPDEALLVDDLGGWVAALLGEASSVDPDAVDPDTRTGLDEAGLALADAVRGCAARLVLVSPEVGLSLVPTTPVGRAFADALGKANQAIAAACGAVILVVAGQPTWLKPSAAEVVALAESEHAHDAQQAHDAPPTHEARPGDGGPAREAAPAEPVAAAGGPPDGSAPPDGSGSADEPGASGQRTAGVPAERFQTAEQSREAVQRRGAEHAQGAMQAREVEQAQLAESAQLAGQSRQDEQAGEGRSAPAHGEPVTGSAGVPAFAPGMELPMPDEEAVAQAHTGLLALDLPGAGLGELARVVTFAAGTQGRPAPRPWRSPRLLLLHGDHAGGASAGVHPDESARRAGQARDGAGPLGPLAARAGADIRVIEAPAADPMEHGPAMDAAAVEAALAYGWRLAQDAVATGIDVLVIGACGSGTEAAAAAVLAATAGAEPAAVLPRVVAPGGRIDDGAWMLRCAAVRDAMHRIRRQPRAAQDVLAQLGGGDIAIATGVLLGATARRTPVLLDGPVGVAAALISRDLAGQARHWCLLPDHGRSPLMRLAADVLGLHPFTDLRLDLGEGATALAALPLLSSGLAVAAAVPTHPALGAAETAGTEPAEAPADDATPAPAEPPRHAASDGA